MVAFRRGLTPGLVKLKGGKNQTLEGAQEAQAFQESIIRDTEDRNKNKGQN